MYRLVTLITGFFLFASFALAQSGGASPLMAGDTTATFEGLGFLDASSPESQALGVSGDGSVVVGKSNWSDSTEVCEVAFRWENGTMEPLSGLDNECTGATTISEAHGASMDGSVIVGQLNTGGNDREAFRWANGDVVVIGDLPGGNVFGGARAVSSDGEVVVGRGHSGATEPFMWTVVSDTMVGMGYLPGGGSIGAEAHGVSANGAVVVGFSDSESTFASEAFRWENGAMEAMGFLPGGSFALSRANSVSADGSVVIGYSSSGNGFNEAFRWTAESDSMVGLGDLPGGGFFSDAFGVSADGSVVVGWGQMENGNEAFIWTEEDGMRNLKEVLESDYGLDLTGWTLQGARAVSDDGLVIVGTGINPLGDHEAWRVAFPVPVTPPAANVAPDSLAFTVPADSSDSDTLTIGNLGGSDLDWAIAEADNQTGACESPSEIAWVSATPNAGTTAPDASGEVVVTVDASGVEPADYAALLCVTTNDPDAETIEIVVAMTVEDLEPPAAEVSPASFAFTVPADGSDSDTLTIGNLGGSDLDWTIAEADNQPGACESPSEVAWVSATPNIGTTTPGASGEIAVTVDASGMEPADYAALLCVTTNDPDADTLEVSVTMTVQGVADEATPEELAEGLSVPQPNPVSGISTFTVAAERGQQVAVEVFDAMGRRVQTLYDGALAAGMSETLTLDATALPAGLYIIRATGEDFVKVRRVTVVR